MLYAVVPQLKNLNLTFALLAETREFVGGFPRSRQRQRGIDRVTACSADLLFRRKSDNQIFFCS
ncbi:MAG TPA: hypothetical protein VFC78_04215 [Tepidisphaeraceae bacterium]|nr:hypothetical protein [Tepidisphaeraceae bacterium]